MSLEITTLHPNKSNTEHTELSTLLGPMGGGGGDKGKPLPPRLEGQTGKYRESWLPRAQTQGQKATVGTRATVGKSEL